MNERIKILADKTVKGEMYVQPITTEYDREDLFLSPVKMSGKRVCEFILNQEPLITQENCFTGLIKFDDSVEGDIFNRLGHKNFAEAWNNFYNKPVHGLTTFEWQHSVGNFNNIITRGLIGIKSDIETSKSNHKDDTNASEFLDTQSTFCDTVIKWAHKCSNKVNAFAQTVENVEYKQNLLALSQGLRKVPEYPATSFYEAVLSLYICYSYVPDSIGLIDRYLYPFYKNDIKNGTLTNEQAVEYLQELFLMLQARISITSDRFYRGGESHFCVGGYLENGDDGFNELSKLIVDALMDLPIWIPQISLRWTKKTPHNVFKYMMDCERKDPNKRIAFVNDEPRLKGLMRYSGLSRKEAINYTMAGCNEPALPGGMIMGIDVTNVVLSITNTFFKRFSNIENATSFEEFYSIYQDELFKVLYDAEKINKGFETIRERDCNIVSNIFFDGCIENAKSVTQGGLTKKSAVASLIGITTVIDSLTVVKQFVFDEKTLSMHELFDALDKNWRGYEELRNTILKKAKYFGNNDNCSNEMARRLLMSLDKWNNHENYLGRKYIFGNLIGYNEHQKFFGDSTKATPDGRFDGDAISFGIGQTEGRDREGLTPLLASVAKCDTNSILVGPSVTNVLLDEQLVKNDDNFNKLVYLFESYFNLGGTHFQLTYVSKEDLINAKKSPNDYKTLRVRVSGFSDYFVLLNEALQDDIIKRTEKVK